MSEEYQPPEHGWTCFHCGETFTTVGSARDHFGTDISDEPGCLLKVGIGGERSLLAHLRKAEKELARHIEEDTDLHRTLYTMQSRHADALRSAEEAGYERGLRDGMKVPVDQEAV